MKSRYFDVEKPKFDYASICLVEGKDDAMFVEKVLELTATSEDDFRIIVCKGKQNLVRTASLLSKSAEFSKSVKTVSVIFDADENVSATLATINRAFGKVGFPNAKLGDFSKKDGRHFGVYLLPDCAHPGELEDIALSLADGHPLLPDAQNYIDKAANEGLSNKLSKRKVQAFLAGASENIRQTVGWAFRDGTIAVPEERVERLVEFIQLQLDLAT